MKHALLGAALMPAFLFLPANAFAQDALIDDEIIVTGSPLIRSVDEAITGLSVLSGDELENRLAGTIGETLKYEPGVSSTQFGAGASRPIIRGQGGDRVRILTNGVGSIDASSASPDHAVAAEPAQAERIEVLRGASLLRYGSSGAGGIVNVIDGRIPDKLPEDGTDASFRAGYSTVDDGFELAGSVDQAVGQIALHLDGTFRDAGDYTIPVEGESQTLLLEEGEEFPDDIDESRELENSFAESFSVTGGASWIAENGFLGLAVHRYESDYGIPGGHGHEEGEEEDHDEDEDEDHDHDEEGEEEEENVTIALRQTRVDLNGAVNLDGVFERVQIFAGVADYTHTEFEGPGEVGTVFTNKGGEGRLELIQAERDGWSAAYGLQYRARDFAAVGEEAFVPPTKTDQFGLYTFQEKEIGDGHIEGALRYERTEQSNPTARQSRDFNLISASIGGDVHLSDALRLGGTVFRTERAPTTEELFSNGPHLATNQFELGDLTLKKEVATGVEAALRHRETGHALTLNLFYTDYGNYIFERETGMEEDGLPVFQFTGQDAKFYGFEAQGSVDLFEANDWTISGDALAEYVRAKTDSGDLPRIPPIALLTGLEAKSDRFDVRGEIEYVGAQKKISEFELPTDDYTMVNLIGGVHFGDVRVSASVMNLFDVEARQHTSFLKDLVPLPGRNFRFSISTKL